MSPDGSGNLFLKFYFDDLSMTKTLKKIVADSGTKSFYGMLNDCF